MNTIPSHPDPALGGAPGTHQPNETVCPTLVDQARAPEAPAKLPVTAAARNYSHIFSDLDDSAAHEQKPAGVNPLFYRNKPPISNLALPADVLAGPGLVRMLATYPGNLPGTAEVPVELANRLVNEVVDHLNCIKLLDVPLAGVTEEWLGSFRKYLEIFYEPERVTCYVETVRLLVGRYRAESEPNPV